MRFTPVSPPIFTLRVLCALCFSVLLSACSTESSLLLPVDGFDQAYRIDISDIDVVYDIVPEAEYVDGRSRMVFEMRAGQSRPLFHFNPWTESGRGAVDSLRRVVLDGEEIPIAELSALRFEGSSQRAFEIDRELAAGSHVLEFEWQLWNWFREDERGWFRTLVDDSTGLGNEALWPTINSPGEQARHRIELRIDSDQAYSAVGSGGVTASVDQGVQVFSIDTVREVASYTVMLCALPQADVIERAFLAGDTPVRMISILNEADTQLAAAVTTAQLSILKAGFGELAVPSVDILLVDWDTGMEYYGGSTTGLGALSHELTHLYWGTTAVNATYRDSWLDESINVWWNFESTPVDAGFRSDILGGRHSLSLGFDGRAYEEGARVIAAVASRMGEDRLLAFLNTVYRARLFTPYTTDDFVADLVAYTGDESWLERFEQWVGKARWAAAPQ